MATSGPLSVVPDLPAWPTLQRPIDMARESHNTSRLPCIPGLEYRPMEYRGLYIDHLDPFSVEFAQQDVSSGIVSGTHLGSGGHLNSPDSEQLPEFSESDTIESSKYMWVPFVRPPAGQATPCQPSGGIGARVEIHPPSHVPGRGEYGLYSTSERGEEVALSNGGMNWAE